MSELYIKHIGQVGFLIKFNGKNIYIDPYLSNSVEEIENESIKRLIDIPIMPEKITDADYVFITHSHRDHCDEVTLSKIAISSKNCTFIGPRPVIDKLKKHGFDDRRLYLINDKLMMFSDISVHAIPSAHPVINKSSPLDCVGYLISVGKVTLYHAGDTSLCSEVIETVTSYGAVDIGMLPVNERNYMRDYAGIIGNMTIREAFYLADTLNLTTLFPTHWDMFEVNQVYKEEIELLYSKLNLGFNIEFDSLKVDC